MQSSPPQAGGLQSDWVEGLEERVSALPVGLAVRLGEVGREGREEDTGEEGREGGRERGRYGGREGGGEGGREEEGEGGCVGTAELLHVGVSTQCTFAQSTIHVHVDKSTYITC